MTHIRKNRMGEKIIPTATDVNTNTLISADIRTNPDTHIHTTQRFDAKTFLAPNLFYLCI